MAPFESSSLKKFSFEELSRFTDGFSEANFIGNTMFGKVYHGKLVVKDEKVMYVTVKIWEDREIYKVKPEEKMSRMAEEVYLLQNQELNSHPNIVKLLGYCCEGEQVGVVYDLKSIGTIYGIISQGSLRGCAESFNWLRRIKAAVGLAYALDFIHSLKQGIGYLVRNIGPQHVMLDEDFSPIIFDFGMVSGGLLADKRNIETEKVDGCHGCCDPCFARAGMWREECDIMSYGGVLLALLTNKVYEEKGLSFENAPFSELFDWAEDALMENKVTNAFGRNKCLLVHESLQTDKGFYRSDGYYLTELMMCCTNEFLVFRPRMKEVVKFFLRLRVVRKYADFMGVKELVRKYKMLDLLKDYVKGSNIFRDQYHRLRFENIFGKY